MAKVINAKQQKMYDSLIFVNTIIGGFIYYLRAPKRLVRGYEKANKREAEGKKTFCYGKDSSLWLFESYLSCCNKSKKTY